MIDQPRHGVYIDDCAPHMRIRPIAIVALLVAMVLWVVLIVVAIVIYRALKG
jgi:hypothetical protein